MAEVFPTISIEQDPEALIAFLKQEDALEGAISNEISLYNEILEKWRNKEIDDEEAIKQAKAVSASRQENVH